MRTVAGAESAGFSRFAWGVLVYVLLVVLWGAGVRATGSGAGCGGHWPLCNGEVVPRSPTAATIIEYTHRLTSGLSLVAVAVLCAWAFRRYPRGSLVRRFAALSAVFLGVEALLGAGLVLLGYVADNRSVGRAVYLSAHLLNTQVLLAMLALTAWVSGGRRGPVSLADKPRLLLAALAAALVLSVTGAMAALGDTLFPAASLSEGLGQEIAPAAHGLLRLRLLHPLAGLAAGGFLMFAAISVPAGAQERRVTDARFAVVGLVLVQWIAGAVNVLLLAPVWMQIIHLLLANLLWLALVILVVQVNRTDEIEYATN